MIPKVEGLIYQGKSLWYPEGLAGIQKLYDVGGMWTAKDIREAILRNAPGGQSVTSLATSDGYFWLCVMRFESFMSESYLFFPCRRYDPERKLVVSERNIALAGDANHGLFSLIQVGMRSRVIRLRTTA